MPTVDCRTPVLHNFSQFTNPLQCERSQQRTSSAARLSSRIAFFTLKFRCQMSAPALADTDSTLAAQKPRVRPVTWRGSGPIRVGAWVLPAAACC